MNKRRYWTGAKRAPAQDKYFIDALDPGLWTRGDETDWDACWHTGMPARGVFRTMKPGQWVNHIPGNHALTVKSRLFASLDAARRRAPAALQDRYRFFPESYLMPEDYHALQREAFRHPEKRWIVKPKSLSRGRGIEVMADASAAPVDQKMLVQDYLSAPHLFDGRKYVLRCYLAIMSVEPLRVYLYREGFAKLASEPYRDGGFENLYAHLTNPDVNALNENAETAVEFHSFANYRRWLAKNGADPDGVFRALRDMAAITAIAARDIMRERIKKSGAWAPGCCELIGMDCMVDADLKPWLLECNLSPSLDVCAAPDAGGAMEEGIKRAVVADLVAMADLNNGDSKPVDPDDIAAVIAASEREAESAGDFERIYPADDAGGFFPFFPAPRYADIALAEATGIRGADDYRFAANAAGEYAFDDEIVLHSNAANKLMSPSTAGAYIWLRASGGDAPGDIARDLAELTDADDADRAALQTVWDTLADWGAADLLTPAGATPQPSDARAASALSPAWAGAQTIRFAGQTFRIRFASPEIAQRIDPVLASLHISDDDATDADEISVLTEKAGYAIAMGPRLVRANLRLAEIASALGDVLKNATQTNPDAPLLAASLWRIGDRTALVASSQLTRWDSLGAACLEGGDTALIAGACKLGDRPGSVISVPLPARIKIDDAESSPAFVSQWRDETRGAFIAIETTADGEHSVDVVIIPAFESARDETVTTALSGRRAFLALASMIEKDALTGNAAARLAQWPDIVPCAEIKCHDRQAGARAVLAAIKNGASNEAPFPDRFVKAERPDQFSGSTASSAASAASPTASSTSS